MATTVTISKIHLGNPAASPQVVSLEYKLWSASSWISIDPTVNIDINGNVIDSPLPSVTGLTEGELYYLRAGTTCDSPAEYFQETFNT